MSKNEETKIQKSPLGEYVFHTDEGRDFLVKSGAQISASEITAALVPANSKAAPQWTVDGELIDEIEAVILNAHPARGAWLVPIEEGGDSAPDCSSFNGIDGVLGPIDNPNAVELQKRGAGGKCKTCPLNEFGSADKGGAKFCAERWWVYVMRPGEYLPIRIQVPVGSLKDWNAYRAALVRKGLRPQFVVTGFKLAPAKSASGIGYFQIKFRAIAKLLVEERNAADDYLKLLDLAPAQKLLAADSVNQIEG